MDDNYLQQLIDEIKGRDGGMILNMGDKAAAVVLSIDKYNELITNSLKDVSDKSIVTNPGLQQLLQNNPSPINQKQKVLVTGGAGYIGAHLVRQLVAAGHEVVVLDNLSTGRQENIPDNVVFIQGDIGDTNLLRDVFATNNFFAVFHMAASLEVEESVREPEKYLENNVVNTAKLLAVMNESNVKNIIFSSTAAVYGQQEQMPIAETARLRPNNPYGHSKVLAERIIQYYTIYCGFRAVVFRYFNACGCDFDGRIKPTHTTHLIHNVLQVAKGNKPQLIVNGVDYKTFDGTCIRDYVHVLDIADAHLKALSRLSEGENFRVYNIGTGKGLSVREVIAAAAELTSRMVPMEVGPRRAGDAPVTIADNKKIFLELGFAPQHSDVETIITTSWKQMSNAAD